MKITFTTIDDTGEKLLKIIRVPLEFEEDEEDALEDIVRYIKSIYRTEE